MNVRYQIPENLVRKAPDVWLASWGGCGFLAPAPGTWGSLGGLLTGLIIAALLFPPRVQQRRTNTARYRMAAVTAFDNYTL